MDLALAFGKTVAELKTVMTEPELHQWAKYARSPGMPMKRLELQLAQLAFGVARGSVANPQNLSVSDFMLAEPDDESAGQYEGDDIVDDAREAFGFNPANDING